MGTVLKGATLAEFEPASVEQADLRISGGRIVARSVHLEPLEGDEVVDAEHRLVMPGLVSTHHHLHAMLLRGARRTGRGYEHEARLRQKLERALTADELQASATASALEGLLAGTTTVFDVHSARAGAGALPRLTRAIGEVGLRAVLAHELSEAEPVRDEILDEIETFSQRARGRFRAAVALCNLDSVPDAVLAAVRDLQESSNLFTMTTIAEDRNEEARCNERFQKSPLDRLFDSGLVNGRAVLVKAVHLAWPELSRMLGTGAWLSHTVRSNMASQAGTATAAKFGVRACLGTDVMPLDVLAEAQAAGLRASDAGQPIDVLRFIANGHRLASEVFGTPIGPLREGAAADLVVFDYDAPTPLSVDTLQAHVLHLSAREVESVMVDGIWRLWKRHVLGVKPPEVAASSREAARAVWARLQS